MKKHGAWIPHQSGAILSLTELYLAYFEVESVDYEMLFDNAECMGKVRPMLFEIETDVQSHGCVTCSAQKTHTSL